jgi:hypothetical protein
MSQKLTTPQFIERAISIHGNKYDYSQVSYSGMNAKVVFSCHKHGDFLQTPLNHLQGNGCNKCRYENHPSLQPKSTSEFVLEAKQKHNNKYDYSLVNYRQSHSKITIICPFHGNFYQTPRHHLNGDGCPKCVKRISFRETQFLNYIHIPDTKENRQVAILGKQVDGIDLVTNTIYEFLGDYWHGNPERFKSGETNQMCHKPHGELYNETIQRLKKLKEAGYNVKYIWENDWKRFECGTEKTPRILAI